MNEKILIGYLIIFGLFEVISNGFHLGKRRSASIARSSRKQHQELPSDISDTHYVIKAVLMFSFGLAFLLSGIAVIIDVKFVSKVLLVLIPFLAYSIIQAIVYRRCWKVWSAIAVYNLPLAYFCFVIR